MSSTFEGPPRSTNDFDADVQARDRYVRQALEQARTEIRTILQEEMRRALRSEFELVREEMRQELDGRKRGKSSSKAGRHADAGPVEARASSSARAGAIIVGSEQLRGSTGEWSRAVADRASLWRERMRRLPWPWIALGLALVIGGGFAVWVIVQSFTDRPGSPTTALPPVEATAPAAPTR
jgi:hypothetical protein